MHLYLHPSAQALPSHVQSTLVLSVKRVEVQGNGVGSSKAYWVMKEDSGPAAEQGLGPVFDLMMKLNVRPAIISFEVVAYILCERGKEKTIQSGVLETSV